MSNTTRTRKPTRKAQPAPPSLDDLLGEDGRPEKVVPICLRGHLQAEWDRLKEEHDAGPGEDDQAMMAERAAKQRVADQMAKVEAEMRAGTVEFRIRALPRRRTPGMAKDQVVWQELFAAHPPRKDKDNQGRILQRDAAAGVNVDTFFDALLRASVVEPELDDDRWQKLTAKLNDGQFDKLAMAAWRLNRDEVDVPFSRAAWKTRTSDAESRRQSASASPSGDSTGGNPSS